MWLGYANDPVVAEQRRQLGEGFAFTLGGALLFQERIYMPTRDRVRFVKEFHGAMAHGHQGIAKTLSRLSREYYFPGMRKVVKDVVSSCNTCIRNKATHHAPYRLMKSPETPPRP